MNSCNIIFIALVATIAAPAIVQSLPPIGGDTFSLLRIVGKMCQGVNATAAQEFWDCYSVAPGMEIFRDCQLKISGELLDSPDHMRNACRSLYNMPRYALCLKLGFDKAGIDQDKSVTLVNQCQAAALGVE